MAEEENAPNAGCLEIKEEDADSESNKAGPSKAAVNSVPKTCYMHIDLTPTNTNKALHACLESSKSVFGCTSKTSIMEIELTIFRWPGQQALLIRMIVMCEYAQCIMGRGVEHILKETKRQVSDHLHCCLSISDDAVSSSNTKVKNENELLHIRGRNGKQEEQELDPKSMSDRYYEVKYLRFQVDKLRSQVDILKFKIDDLKYGHRSRSRYLRSTILRFRHCQQDGRSNPSLESVLEDEDERREEQQEQEAPKSGKSEKESETAHQRHLTKGKASLIDFSTSEQHQEEDCMGPLKSIDEILSNQMTLYEEINLLLAEVNGLISQALDLSKTTICHEQAPTFPNIVEELNRSGMTNSIEPRSLFWTSLDLANKVNLLRTQVMALDSLVANPKSPLRTHAGGWISGYFRQRGRSSPTLGRTREAESSSSDAALERRRGKEILKGCGFSFLQKKK